MSSASAEDAQERFRDLLTDGIVEGIAAISYTLGIDSSVRSDLIEKAYGGVSIFEKMSEYYEKNDFDSAYTLVESEWHRCYCEAGYLTAKTSDLPIAKRWVDCDDGRTRLAHDYLGGIKIGLDDDFYTANGSGKYPGGFDDTRDNAGCRCILEYEYI